MTTTTKLFVAYRDEPQGHNTCVFFNDEMVAHEFCCRVSGLATGLVVEPKNPNEFPDGWYLDRIAFEGSMRALSAIKAVKVFDDPITAQISMLEEQLESLDEQRQVAELMSGGKDDVLSLEIASIGAEIDQLLEEQMRRGLGKRSEVHEFPNVQTIPKRRA